MVTEEIRNLNGPNIAFFYNQIANKRVGRSAKPCSLYEPAIIFQWLLDVYLLQLPTMLQPAPRQRKVSSKSVFFQLQVFNN